LKHIYNEVLLLIEQNRGLKMKLKDIEIKIMSDEAYGDHLDQLFEDTRDEKITGKQKTKIVAHS